VLDKKMIADFQICGTLTRKEKCEGSKNAEGINKCVWNAESVWCENGEALPHPSSLGAEGYWTVPGEECDINRTSAALRMQLLNLIVMKESSLLEEKKTLWSL